MQHPWLQSSPEWVERNNSKIEKIEKHRTKEHDRNRQERCYTVMDYWRHEQPFTSLCLLFCNMRLLLLLLDSWSFRLLFFLRSFLLHTLFVYTLPLSPVLSSSVCCSIIVALLCNVYIQIWIHTHTHTHTHTWIYISITITFWSWSDS